MTAAALCSSPVPLLSSRGRRGDRANVPTQARQERRAFDLVLISIHGKTIRPKPFSVRKPGCAAPVAERRLVNPINGFFASQSLTPSTLLALRDEVLPWDGWMEVPGQTNILAEI